MDYRTHFFANDRSFFILFALWVPVDVADTLLKGTAHFRSLGAPYVASAVIMITLLVCGAITRSERFHGFIAVYLLCHTVTISFLFFRTLM